jgi:proteasome alpha subunit
VSDEPGFVAFGGQADQVSAALKERYRDGLTLAEAFGAALTALAAPSNGEQRPDVVAAQLEVAVLDRARDHRTFRRIRAARLEELIGEVRAADQRSANAAKAAEAPPEEPEPGDSGPQAGSGAASNGGDAPSSPE